VLQYIHLNEDETTSSSRIFIKILFQEVSEYLGLAKLNERLKDPTMVEHFSGYVRVLFYYFLLVVGRL